MSLSFKVLFLFNLLFLTSCNHLLYPAERQAFVEQKSIRPIPQDIYIPVLKNDKNSFLHAWYFSANSKIKKGLVVHFHGNGQNLTTHFLFMNWIIEYGYDYLIFDYRGYGASSDEQATQLKTVQDGEAIFNYLHENYQGVPIIAFGQSLGSNVLVRTLQELNQKGFKELLPSVVVLESSFLSYQQAGSSVLGQKWFLYPLKPLVYLALSDEWSAANLIKFTPEIPALFFHGNKDSIIDYKLGKKNYELWPGEKIFITQEEGGHISAFADKRFIKSRIIFLQCMDNILSKKGLIENCAK